MPEQLTILLSGMIAADPDQGGATWAVLQYLLGFRRLGHRVVFVEGMQDTSLAPKGVPLDRTRNASYFRRVMGDFGFDSASALLVAGTRQTIGLSYDQLRAVARSADVLINISGILTDEELTGGIPCRVYLDLDPAFNQLWHALHGLQDAVPWPHPLRDHRPGHRPIGLPGAHLRPTLDHDPAACGPILLAGGPTDHSRCADHRRPLAELWLDRARRHSLWPKGALPPPVHHPADPD